MANIRSLPNRPDPWAKMEAIRKAYGDGEHLPVVGIMRSQLFIEIQPDWIMFGSPNQIEKELGNFEFKGEGWYPKNGDWCLIVPHHDDLQKGVTYKLYVYNKRDPRDMMQRVAMLPTR